MGLSRGTVCAPIDYTHFLEESLADWEQLGTLGTVVLDIFAGVETERDEGQREEEEQHQDEDDPRQTAGDEGLLRRDVLLEKEY